MPFRIGSGVPRSATDPARRVRVRRGRSSAGLVSAACALILICAASRPLAQSEAFYLANIGRTAINPATGAALGRIVGAALSNGVWIYRVNRDGRIIVVPVDSVGTQNAAAVVVKSPVPLTQAARVEPLLLSTATEFRNRLAQSGGTLQALLLTTRGISAEWISTKCGAFEPEVIGLLQSITRTQKASPAVTGTRTCGVQTRTFTITGATVDGYRSGTIGDPGIRAALK
jgi:hypothetical protein